jgi:hypothetical protein
LPRRGECVPLPIDDHKMVVYPSMASGRGGQVTLTRWRKMVMKRFKGQRCVLIERQGVVKIPQNLVTSMTALAYFSIFPLGNGVDRVVSRKDARGTKTNTKTAASDTSCCHCVDSPNQKVRYSVSSSGTESWPYPSSPPPSPPLPSDFVGHENHLVTAAVVEIQKIG